MLASQILMKVYGISREEADAIVNDLAMEIMMLDKGMYQRFPGLKAKMTFSEAMFGALSSDDVIVE